MNAPESSEEDLLQQVESGLLTEQQALRRLSSPSGPRPQGLYDINEAFLQYKAGTLPEDLFWHSLLRFANHVVRHQSPDRSTFSNIEDAIGDAALSIWQRLREFDAKRSTFRTFATVIVLTHIRMLMRQYKADRGGMEHIQLDEEHLPTRGLGAEQRMLFAEWLKTLEPTDRRIVQMVKDGLTQQEIGEALEISQSAVAQRLGRIRQQEKPPF
jgi:RNA polymerase sigma factor (sigma-70 family)